MANATFLVDVLRNAGCHVVECPGWQFHGRGEMGDIVGVMIHHTGPGNTKTLLNLLLDGRGPPNPLPGPLSQMFLDDDGTFYVLAAGRTNHAGRGVWMGVTAGNTQFLGIECRNKGDGQDEWEPAQMEALTKGVAAILRHIGAPDTMCVGHKEWALPKGRKIDPTFEMRELRADVQAAMYGSLAASRPPAKTDPVHSMLAKGDVGVSVKELQELLGFRDAARDGRFGPKTEEAVKTFQKAHGLVPDGKVGPKTWAALGVH